MAFLKEKLFPNGIKAKYWKISVIEIGFISKTARAHLHLYVDKESRDAGMDPYATPFFDFSSDNFRFSMGDLDKKNPVKIAYELLKEGEFSDAEDV
jgi:hypothetical protein